MADRPTCATCRFWEPPDPGYPNQPGGECRAQPPEARGWRETGDVKMCDDGKLRRLSRWRAGWPETMPEHWCGEHQYRGDA
jgi:hypothetical protein